MSEFIIYILFNVKFPHLGNNTNSNWLDKRLALFQRYTLKSLINQTHNKFRVILYCCPESRNIMTDKMKSLKFNNPDMKIVDCRFGINDLYTAISRMKFNYIFFLKLDSDDMYHRNAISDCIKYLPKKNTIQMLKFHHGYVYSLITKSFYDMTKGCPFYCTMYPRSLFTTENLLKHSFSNQNQVDKKFHPIPIGHRRFIVLDHMLNLSKNPKRDGVEMLKRVGVGSRISKINRKNICSEFGLRC
jgi:hypothetical protein